MNRTGGQYSHPHAEIATPLSQLLVGQASRYKMSKARQHVKCGTCGIISRVSYRHSIPTMDP
jgi:hypothetical protein